MTNPKAYFFQLLKKSQAGSGNSLSKAGPSGKERRISELRELQHRAAPLAEGQTGLQAELTTANHGIQMNRMKNKADPLASKDPGNAITYHQGFDAKGQPNMEGAATVLSNPGSKTTVPRQPGKHSLLGGAVRDQDWDKAKDIVRSQTTSIKDTQHMPIHQLYFKTLRNKTNGTKK